MIEVERFCKTFPLPGGESRRAVDELSFHVRAGEVYGLLGPNGAGKTTTLRMLLGLMSPTSGRSTVRGYCSAQNPDEVKRQVGFVSANAGVYPWLRVREMLLYFANLYAVPPVTAAERLEQLADHFDMRGFLDQRCGTLSTGQRQRLNLCRALMHDPVVLLLDEPLLGLDVVGSQAITRFIDHLRGQRKGIILCTHHLDEAQRLCDRFGLMHQGRLVAEGTIEALRQQTGRYTLLEMFLDLVDPDHPLPANWRSAVADTPSDGDFMGTTPESGT